MRIASVFIFAFILCSLNAQKDYEKYIYINAADSLPYKLLRPLKKFSAVKLPLVIFFHGAGERGSDNEVQTEYIDGIILDSLSRNIFPCYLIAPQCPKGKKWVDMDWTQVRHKQPPVPSMAMILAHKLIDSLKKTLNIDTMRIYVTGLSMGAFATWDYCARYTNEVAAAVPVSGGYDELPMKKLKSVPLWIFHGAQDNLVPTENARILVSALKRLKANVKYSELPGIKHNAWIVAYKDDSILRWMFQFRKKQQR